MKKAIVFILSFITAVALFGQVAFASLYGAGTYGACPYSSDCGITLTTSGTVNLNSIPTTSGRYTTASDSVTVTTDSTTGYTLSLQNQSATEGALVKGSDNIPAHGATAASPTTLGLNTWGFRVDGQAGFGAGPTTAVTDQPSMSLTFAGVPLNGSPVIIKNNTTGGASAGELTSVWYGIQVDNSKPSGTYSSTVVYTATTQL